MRKLLLVTIWLLVSISGVISVIVSQRSWQCSRILPVTSVLFNPKTSVMLVIYEGGKELQFWNETARNAEKQFSVLGLNNNQNSPIYGGHTDDVTSVAFSPDGKLILTGSADRTAKLWDAGSGQELHTFTGHTNGVTSVAFSPDGKLILTGSKDKSARLWDAGSGQEIHTFTGHTNLITSIAFSPNGKHILTGSADGTARLWDIGNGQEVHKFSNQRFMWSVAFSPNGKLILTGGNDNNAKLWDAESGQELHTFTGHTNSVWSVAFSPDSKRILIGSADGTATLWDTQTTTLIRPLCPLVSSEQYLLLGLCLCCVATFILLLYFLRIPLISAKRQPIRK